MTTEKDKYPNNDLKWIVKKDKPVLLKLVLENYDCDLEKNYGNSTLLATAAMEGHIDCLQLLLDHGAPVNQISQDGNAALHWATFKGSHECVKLLLENKALVNIRSTKRQKTALMLAAEAGYKDIAKLLAEHGADVHAKDIEGKTVLDYAEKGQTTTCIQLLLNNDGQPKHAELLKTIAAIKEHFAELESQLNNYE